MAMHLIQPPTGITQARVLVMGDVMLDRYWFGQVDRISPEAPVPIALVKREEHRLGGAANVARNIAALGAHADVVGMVGTDAANTTLQTLLLESGVEAHLCNDASFVTTLKLRVIGHNQQLLRIDFEAPITAAQVAALHKVFATRLADADIVLFSDYGKGALQEVAAAIQQARNADKTILVDPKGSDYQRYKGATILTPNRSELKAVIGDWSSEAVLTERAQNLRRAMGWQYLLLTRSEEGMTLFQENGVITVAAQAREVYDVTGAGDTVIAVLAVMLAVRLPIEEAIHWANKAAGIAVAKFGTVAVSAAELWTADLPYG